MNAIALQLIAVISLMKQSQNSTFNKSAAISLSTHYIYSLLQNVKIAAPSHFAPTQDQTLDLSHHHSLDHFQLISTLPLASNNQEATLHYQSIIHDDFTNVQCYSSMIKTESSCQNQTQLLSQLIQTSYQFHPTSRNEHSFEFSFHQDQLPSSKIIKKNDPQIESHQDNIIQQQLKTETTKIVHSHQKLMLSKLQTNQSHSSLHLQTNSQLQIQLKRYQEQRPQRQVSNKQNLNLQNQTHFYPNDMVKNCIKKTQQTTTDQIQKQVNDRNKSLKKMHKFSHRILGNFASSAESEFKKKRRIELQKHFY